MSELTVTQLAAEPSVFAGHIRDVSQRKHAEADQLRLAAIMHSTNDAVIGWKRSASRRAALASTSPSGCRRSSSRAASCSRPRGAVFLVDLDQFKLINDSLGHAQGYYIGRPAEID